MRVLVTGDRNWTDHEIIRNILYGYTPLVSIEPVVVIHGAARGADSIAGEYAAMIGFEVEEYPADWGTHHRAAGPIRNRQMLKEGKPDVVLAFHDDLASSKGTKDMVDASLAAGVPVYNIRRMGDRKLF